MPALSTLKVAGSVCTNIVFRCAVEKGDEEVYCTCIQNDQKNKKTLDKRRAFTIYLFVHRKTTTGALEWSCVCVLSYIMPLERYHARFKSEKSKKIDFSPTEPVVSQVEKVFSTCVVRVYPVIKKQRVFEE